METDMTRTKTMRSWRAGLTAGTILAGVTVPLAAIAQLGQTGAGATWTTERGDLQGTGYSTLTEINSSNVQKLVEDFSIPTNAFRNHEGAPLVVNNRMYFVTPFATANSPVQSQVLYAIDLTKKGKVLWSYNPNANPGARAQACCDVDNRGPAYVSQAQGAPNADGLIVFNTLDGYMVGVNAVTGAQVWRTQLTTISIGATLTGAPIVADGIAMVGNSGAEDGVRGQEWGVNVTTGAIVWTAYNTGPDADVLIGSWTHNFYAKDRGTDLGVTSWNGGNWWQQGGATSWGYHTYDPVNDLWISGTGNADPWLSVTRGGKGDAKWAASIIARKPATGQVAWVTQLTPNDNYDFDSISEAIVADITFNGKPRHVLVHTDKNGYTFTLDAATGEILVAGDTTTALNGGATYVNWAQGYDLKTGRPINQIGAITKYGPGGAVPFLCPSASGVKDPEPDSFSFLTNLVYIPAHNGCTTHMGIGANWMVGIPYTGNTGARTANGTPITVVSPGSPGGLVAWNPATGAPAWTVLEPYQLWGGVLTTAGNLVVYGTLSNGTDAAQNPTVKILNSQTGALLWSTALECNTVGSPMSFIGADGHQRIAIFTGTGSTGNAGTGQCPFIQQYNPVGRPPGRETAKTSTWLGQEQKIPATAATSTAETGYLHVFKLP
jgi:alcohol dehydrogenase (cytochrome c)